MSSNQPPRALVQPPRECQVHGGLVQGIGQALLENVHYAGDTRTPNDPPQRDVGTQRNNWSRHAVTLKPGEAH
jgi:hypothetical protein